MLGLIAGAIVKLIIPGDGPGGIIVTILLGIVGAVIGGFLASLVFGTGLQNFWSLQTWIVAIVGSLILLGGYRAVSARDPDPVDYRDHPGGSRDNPDVARGRPRPIGGRRHYEPFSAASHPRSTTEGGKGAVTSTDFSFRDASEQTTGRPGDKVRSGTAVFINYRRAETSLHADLIYKELVALLGPDAVFKDVDSLRPGEEFRQVINNKIALCRVVLVLIGRTWVSITDGQGRRRLDSTNDPVRIEIETALRYNLTIIPVLCDEMPMPCAEELPVGIVKLVDRHACKMSPANFTSQARELAKYVKGKLE